LTPAKSRHQLASFLAKLEHVRLCWLRDAAEWPHDRDAVFDAPRPLIGGLNAEAGPLRVENHRRPRAWG
jgi:hypothetical protein